MKLKKGVTLITENRGDGKELRQGDLAEFELEILLNHGDQVSKNIYTRKINRANLIPGLVYSMVGMKEGGYREVKISPHLAHGALGVKGVIPEDAALVCKVWLRQVNA
ncbi:FKBP-type peptidyl-prolyl cis-trans isomerase [Microbulbifer agarilyticus]